MSPKVSIIVPVYNVEAFLPRCLDSILAQTLREIEVICVNDGSPDGAQAILDRFAASDPRVRVLVRENGGLSAARNTGLQAVTAPFVMFCDSDDWVEPTWCEELVTAIESSGADFVVSQAQIDGTCPERKRKELQRNQRQRWQGLQTVVPRMVAKVDHAVWTKIFRMAVIRQHALTFPEGKVCEDWLFSQCYLAASKNVFFLPRPLYHYFQRTGSILNGGEKGIRSDCDYIGHWLPFCAFLKRINRWEPWRLPLMTHYGLLVAAVALTCADRDRLYDTTEAFVRTLTPDDRAGLDAAANRGLDLVLARKSHYLRTDRWKLGPLTISKIKRTTATTTVYVLGLPVFRRRWV